MAFLPIEEQLWRKAQERREEQLQADKSEAEVLLLPLVLSLARLAAQRDTRGRA